MKMENPNENDFSGALYMDKKTKPQTQQVGAGQRSQMDPRQDEERDFFSHPFPGLLILEPKAPRSTTTTGNILPQGSSKRSNALAGTKGFYIPCFSAEIFRHCFVSRLGNHEDACHGPLRWRCNGSKVAWLSSSFRKVWDASPNIGFLSYFTSLWPNTD